METLNKTSLDYSRLVSVLLSTLDESLFFAELMKELTQAVSCDKSLLYLVHEESGLKNLVTNNIADSSLPFEKNEGLASYVVRTKKPYFSNNVLRDPIFAKDLVANLRAELALPLAVEGVVIATVHFQSFSEKEFSVNDITKVLSILAEIKKPLANIKMFLSAKHLNEILLKKIENKETEAPHTSQDSTSTESFKISDFPLIGKSDFMKSLVVVASKLAQTDCNYLITGESGVGKEAFARKIHVKSSRKEKAFITLDCSSFAEETLEKEIFGEENNKRGLLELAHGGTLLLKKISSLSLKLQAKIISQIKEGRSFRIQGQVPFKSSVRIVGTDSTNLSNAVSAGTFRSDLYYALTSLTLEIAPLREHRDDIEALAVHFISNRQKTFSASAMKVLKEYEWKGNVSEVKSIVERACVLADGMVIEVDHLSSTLLKNKDKAPQEKTVVEAPSFTQMTLDELEKKHICQTLDYLGGNKTRAAKTLGITVKTLYNKLHNYGLIDEREAQ